MSLVLLILCIVFIIYNGKLKNEIDSLKATRINYCPKCGHQLIKKEVQQVQQATIQNNSNNRIEQKANKIINKKPKMNDEEIKNNIILITGSILIVFAAIIYLTSSWTMTSNLLKCIVIFVLFFVFILASYIAKNKLKLIQTAKAFNYIALAYLPLSLISLSLFSLLGENFSINGSFQNLYFSFIFIFTSIVYFVESKTEDDKFLSIASVITTILAIIFLVNVFTNSFLVLIIFLYLYSYFLAILYEKNIYISNEKITTIIIKILFYSLFTLLVFILISILSFDDYSLSQILQTIAIIILNAGLSLYLGKNTFNKGLVPTSIIVIFYLITKTYDFSSIVSQLIIILGIEVVYLYNYITEKKINIYNFLLISFVMMCIFMQSLLSFEKPIPIYIVSYIYVMMLGITYYLNEKFRKAMLWMIPIFIEFGTILLVIEKELSINILIGLSTLFLVCSLIPKLKGKAKELIIVPSSLNIIYVLLAYDNKSLITTILIIVSIISYYLLFLRVNKNYKYPLYVAINLGMMYIGHLICNGLDSYTMALSIILIISLEVIDERLKDSGNFIYILIDYFITATALTTTDKRTAFIMTIVISLVMAAYIFDNKKNVILYCIPLLTPFVYIGASSVMTFNTINVMPYISMIIIVLVPFLVIKNKEFIKLAFIPYIYIVQLCSFGISLYYPIILSLCVSLIYYNFSEKKILFKILTLTSTLLLYYKVIYDLQLILVLFTIGILLLYALYITRNVLKNDMDTSKALEYIAFLSINMLAISSYSDEIDGMLFVILLLIITIYSYLKKYGPAFLISIIFILVNIFLLTREFWFSLPWWIYILGVGIILILFAVLNEINEKDNIKEKISGLKNNLKL